MSGSARLLNDDAKVGTSVGICKLFGRLFACTDLILDLRQTLDMYHFARFFCLFFGFLLDLHYLCSQNVIDNTRFMENSKNRFLSISYSLYIDEDGEKRLVEKTSAGQPFQFISGFGIALDAFEKQLTPLEKGEAFEFALTKEQAYGDYHDELLQSLDREMFFVNGRFDHEHIYQDAVIQMQNEEGSRFFGRVVEVGETKVKVDLNHPLAGETLLFKGEVLENREATDDEITLLMKQLTGGCEGCGGCGGCDSDCGGDCQGEHHKGGCNGEHHKGGCNGEHHKGGCGHCH